MNGLQKAGIATVILGGAGMIGFSYFYNKLRARPDLEEKVQDCSMKIDYDNNKFTVDYSPSEKIPMPVRLNFDANAYTACMTQLILPLQKVYRQDLGERGFTAYEMLQILGRNVDNMDWGNDVGKITLNEVLNAVKKYNEAKAKGDGIVKLTFDLDLEKPKDNMPGNPGNTIGDLKSALDDEWAVAQKRVKFAEADYRRQEAQYNSMWQREQAACQAEWNARRQYQGRRR